MGLDWLVLAALIVAPTLRRTSGARGGLGASAVDLALDLPFLLTVVVAVAWLRHFVLPGAHALDFVLAPLGWAATLAAILVRLLARGGASRGPLDRQALLVAGGLLGAVVAVRTVFGRSFLLPAEDAIAIPTYAALILREGGWIGDFLPFSTELAYYPLGFSYLVAMASPFFPEPSLLSALRELHLTALALVPAAWAYATYKVFDMPKEHAGILLLSFYGGFFFFDRNLLVGTTLAGKNAQLFTGFFLPFVVVRLLRARTALDCLLAGLGVLGVVMLHYSSLYVLALIGLGYVVARHKGRSWLTWRQALIGATACALLVPHFLRVSAAGVALGGPPRGLTWHLTFLRGQIFGERTDLFYIPASLGLAELTWPYKGTILVGLAAIGLVARRMRRPVAVFALATCGAALIGTGVIPNTGIDFDYTRWFAFFLHASLASVAIAAVTLEVTRGRAWVATLILAGALVHFWSSAHVGDGDLHWVKKTVAADTVTRATVLQTQQELQALEDPGGCGLLLDGGDLDGSSYEFPKPLKYAPALTSCLVLNGHAAFKPWPDSRVWRERLPEAPFLARVLSSGLRVALVTTPEVAALYQRDHPELRVTRLNASILTLEAWRVELDGTDPNAIADTVDEAL